MTSVRLHALGVREDRGEWIVGRPDTGVCVAVPYEGMRAVQLLQEGMTILAAQQRLRAETGANLDVGDFVAGMAAVGLVVSIGDRVFEDVPVHRPSLPWLSAGLVRWTLSPVLHWLMAALVAGGIAAALVRPEVIPGWRTLLWMEHGTLVLLGEVAVVAVLFTLHELAHLCTARAAGVPGRIRLDTRLQFLAVQTDVSGIWLAERRVRLTVYLAGMTVDAAVLGTCLGVMAIFDPHPVPAIVALMEMTGLALQFLVFMRTDLYFLIQDLTGCRNLYAGATAYLLYVVRRGARRPATDPLAGLEPGERRATRLYSGLMLAGTALCLGAFLQVSLPFTATLIGRSLGALARHDSLVATVDALATLAVLAGYQYAWCRAWRRRHGARVRRWTAKGVARYRRPRPADQFSR
ncbi:hypothetical protein GCM10022226_18020 [Sphaerisporangium flaviroseum]|uniref:Peptidase M50 n=1 Tax=Sphaerisporangium flaviroseum TaxID=509199 RepID=A0ABP7HPQ3_9ACTN